MTYETLQNLTSVYLLGDNTVIKDELKLLAALESAYLYAATKCTALKLLTVNRDQSIMRMGPGRTYVRMPKLPRDKADKLDIDHELGPAIARILAHYMAKDIHLKEYHKVEALELMREYENKVIEFLEENYAEGKYDDYEAQLANSGS